MSDAAENSLVALELGGAVYWLLGLVPACIASYFKYQARGNALRDELDENLYRLQAEDMDSFNDMQKQLLSSSWNLMNMYHLPDEFRLVQKSMDDFYRAVEEPDTSARRLRMLKTLEEDFRVYPPYWYYRARTAQEVNDSAEAEKCFTKFEEVWRPVLRRDPYKLEVTKYRIGELLKNGIPEDKQEILNLAGVMREHTLREDWANNLFAGVLYYALGDVAEAEKCVEINIDFGHEQELSTAMLKQIRLGIDSSRLLSDTLRTQKLTRLLADLQSKDVDGALLVADYFDGRNPNLESSDNVLALHARRIIELRRADASSFRKIYDLAKAEIDSKAEIHRLYSGAFNMVKSYADDDNISAQIFLADMFNYGWGVDRNIDQAANYYLKAGDKKDMYSQFMYLNLMLARENYPASESQSKAPDELSEGNSDDEIFDVGMNYYGKEDYDNAIACFQTAATNGHAGAAYMLGVMFENGRGRARNLAAARSWYLEAAQKGHAGAQKAYERLSGNSRSWWGF